MAVEVLDLLPLRQVRRHRHLELEAPNPLGALVYKGPVALLAPAELFLDELLLCDIVLDALPVERTPRFVAHEGRLVPDPDYPPVAGVLPVLGPEGLTGPVGPLVLGEHPLPVVRVHDVQPVVRVEQLPVHRVAEHALGLGADVGNALVAEGLLHVGDGRYLLDERPVAGLGLPRPLLGLLAPGDVARQDENQRAPPTLEHADAHLHGKGAPVLASVLALERQGDAGGDLRPQIFQGSGVVTQLHVRHGHAEQFLLGETQRLARPAIDVHEAAPEVVYEHSVGGLLDEAPEPDLAPRQRLLGPRAFPANLGLLELPLDGRAEAGHVLPGEVVVGAGLHDPDRRVLPDLAGYTINGASYSSRRRSASASGALNLGM